MKRRANAADELRRAVERAPQAMWCVDDGERLLWANAAARCLLSIEEADEESLPALVGDEVLYEQLRSLRRAEGHAELAWRDGRRLRVTAYPVHEEEASPRYVFTAVEVASGSEEQREAPEAEGASLRQLLEQVPVGAFIAQEGRFVYVNERLAQLAGYRREALTAASFEVSDLFVEPVAVAGGGGEGPWMEQPPVEEGAEVHRVVRMNRPGEAVTEVQLHGVRLQHDGQTALAGVVAELTEEHRAAASMHAMLDSSPLGFILLDRDRKVLSYNRAAQWLVQRFYQITLRRGEAGDRFIRPEHHASFRQQAMRALIGETVRSEHQVDSVDEGTQWVELIYSPATRKDRVVGVCVSMHEVTQRKEAEVELQHRERRLRQQNEVMLELTHQRTTSGVQVDDVIRTINERVAETLEVAACAVWCFDDSTARCADFYDRETDAHESRPDLFLGSLSAYVDVLTEHRTVDFTNLTDDPRFERLHDYIRRRGITHVLHAPIRQDRRVVGVVALEHLRTSRTWRAEERQFLSSAADFIALALEAHERRRMQEALREAYQRLELHIQNSPLAFIDLDGEMRVRRWSQRAEELFGYSADEVMGKRLIEDLGLAHDVDVAYIARQVQDWLEGDEPTMVLRNRNITRDGRELECEWYNSVVRDEDGEVVALVSLVQDVTRQVEHERELVAAKEEAEEMNRVKTAFLANMSHEVRTPLTAIIGFADVLAEEVSEPHRELVGFIRRGGMRLMETLDSVLNLAQLEGRAFRLEPLWFDLVAFTDDRIALFQLQAEQRGLELRLEAPEDAIIRVRLDASALGRVLSNLVSNAIKFTAEGRVTVRVRQDGDEVEMQVADTGVGIGASFLPFVFDEFRQESSGVTRRFEGSGLGLAISRRLVELMGGTIAVDSTKGVGTTFTVRLPRVMSYGAGRPSDVP